MRDPGGTPRFSTQMVLTRGVSPTFSRDPRDAHNQLICFAIPFGWILKPEDREAGLAIAISDIRRIPPESIDPTVKNYHWLDFVMGLYDAYERGAQNVVLRTPRATSRKARASISSSSARGASRRLIAAFCAG